LLQSHWPGNTAAKPVAGKDKTKTTNEPMDVFIIFFINLIISDY
jgi:hypothetical protein